MSAPKATKTAKKQSTEETSPVHTVVGTYRVGRPGEETDVVMRIDLPVTDTKDSGPAIPYDD